MAWRYCECGGELKHPTALEALTEDYNCFSCGASIHVWDEEKQDAFIEILDRIEKLEAAT